MREYATNPTKSTHVYVFILQNGACYLNIHLNW